MTVFMNRLVWAGAASIALVSTASAHITLDTAQAPAGGSYKAVIRVPHGCDGAATTALKVTIPEGFYNVKPMPHAGWEIETVNGAYAKTYMSHGVPVAEGLQQVAWKNGTLPDAYYDEFVMQGTLSADIEPGTVLYFQTEQTCADGSVSHWVGMGGAAGEEPAPRLTVTAAAAGAHQSHGDHASADVQASDDVAVGDLAISGAFARATLPGAPVGGGFLDITNNGDTDDRLVSVSSDVAGVVQLHAMRMDGDVMKMSLMPDGIPLPAHETVPLQPGGMHLMFMKLNGPLREGSTINVDLTFEKAGEVTVPFQVRGIAAVRADGDMPGMDHAR